MLAHENYLYKYWIKKSEKRLHLSIEFIKIIRDDGITK
jgi:hypothetical protein